MTAMNPTTATEPEILTDQRMRAETNKLLAESNKLLAEMFKVAAEQYKINAEAPKMTPEPAWYPFVAMAAAAAVGAAIAGVTAKLFG